MGRKGGGLICAANEHSGDAAHDMHDTANRAGKGVMGMHRKALIDQANDIAAGVMETARLLGMPEPVMRQLRAGLVTAEFAEMNEHVRRSQDQHGEITPRCERYLRENLRDLLRNAYGMEIVPTDEAATSLAAD
jgi:hypothetical protein